MFHGDGPAAKLEGGQQKAGHFYCPVCSMVAYHCDDISYSYYCRNLSLEEKKEVVMNGKFDKAGTLTQKLKPFANLSTKQLKEKEHQQSIKGEGN